MDSDGYFFDVEPILSAPTILYGLEPAELDTGSVESLVGYMARLANAHKLPLRTLMLWLFSHHSYWLANPNPLKNFGNHTRHNAVGLGENARGWTTLLSALTGRADLFRCSMAWTSDVLAECSLLAHSARYCPLCFRDHENNGTEPFDRLLWQVGCVTVCPNHKIKLREKRCGKHSDSTGRRVLRRAGVGHCISCGSVSFDCDTTPLDAATPEESWIANQVVDLLHHGSLVERLSREDLVRGINALVEKEADGKPSILARRCGLSRSLTWALTKRDLKSRVALPALLQLSSAVGCSLISLLKGTPAYQSNVPHIQLCNKVKRPIPRQKIENTLRGALKSNYPPLSLTAIAQQLDVSRRSIQNAYPELVSELHLRYSEYSKQAAASKKQRLEDECQTILGQLVAQGRSPTLRNAGVITGKRWHSNSEHGLAFMRLRGLVTQKDPQP